MIGLLGCALPVLVSIGGRLFYHVGVQGSISAYYHTGMVDVFVGTLWVLGFFLIAYPGYDRCDNNASTLAGVCAIGVARFPTASDCPTELEQCLSHIHATFAAVFFLTMSCFALFQFTKSKADQKWYLSPCALWRDRTSGNQDKCDIAVYMVCGYVMLGCILLMACFEKFKLFPNFGPFPRVFSLETILIEAFGISWLIKGEAIKTRALATAFMSSASNFVSRWKSTRTG